MARLGAVLYLMGILLWGGGYQSQMISESEQASHQDESKIMAESMVLTLNALKRFAESNPNLTNQTVPYNQISLPSWFNQKNNIALAVHSGSAFVYCTIQCPSGLLKKLLDVTHGSPFVGYAEGGKLKSISLINMDKSIPGVIPDGAVIYAQ